MSGRRAFITTSVFFVLSVSSGLLATEWHVAPPPLGNDGNPGTNALPFATIQRGIDASSHADTVIVAEGTYVENIQFNGKNIVLTSTGPLYAKIVGKTIIDGNKAGSVVTFSGTETQACILSGFTVRNGLAEYGAGILSAGDQPTQATIQSNTITDNSAGDGGGLAYCQGTIQNNTIRGNWARFYGGGLAYCDGTIQNNTITGNSTELDGGGVSQCDGTIQNNTITGNSAQNYGGGLDACWGTIQSNTIIGNYALHNGGGLYYCAGTIRNCVIWANTAASGPQLYQSAIPTYSCIQDWTGGGEGDIALNPQFVNATVYDYHLQEGSPCIDAGVNEDWMWTAADLDGNMRIFHGGLSLTVDMGAYEYGSHRFRVSHVLAEATGGFQLTWASRPGDKYAIWSCINLTSGAWTQEQMVSSAGNSTSWTDLSPGGSRKFYKVQLN